MSPAIVISVMALGGLTVGVNAQNRAPIQGHQAQYQDPIPGGTIDLHIHSGPDTCARVMNHIEVARFAKQADIRRVIVRHPRQLGMTREQMPRAVGLGEFL